MPLVNSLKQQDVQVIVVDRRESVDDESVLRDAFQELLTFKNHSNALKGIKPVVSCDVSAFSHQNPDAKFNHYVSWDSKVIISWQDGKVLDQIKFPSHKPSYITCVVYLSHLNVYFGASADMKFIIYDSKLNIIETIAHEERTLLAMEYDINTNLIVLAGASGVSVWRVYRNMSLQLSHVVEKMFAFDDCPPWVSRMSYDNSCSRIFAIVDRSVHVLSFYRRKVPIILSNFL